VLVPALAVFGCRELPQDGPVSVGRTPTHVVIRIDNWTFYLAIDTEGRYPRAEDVMPKLPGAATTCRLAPEDLEFLARTLPRLPGDGLEHSPVTLDLNGHVAVRARAQDQGRATELQLLHSTVDGPPMRFVSNRQYLARMVQLGFQELRVVKADVPVVCAEEKRTLVWMPLGKDGALPPSDDNLQIQSTGEAPKKSPTTKKERKTTPMPTPSSNGNNKNGHVVTAPRESTGGGRKAPHSINALMEEAAELKFLLRDAYARAGGLLKGLKRHRQQSKLLASTLTSLKQLQQIPE